MRSGIIVLAQHASSEGERSVAERCADYLRSNGRKNVHIGYHYGSPSSDTVMESMNRDGVDTFVILPLSISEGKMTVWTMPKKLGLPDNCGSWRMMNGKDIATRFATALGKNYALAEELIAREGTVRQDTALLILAYGSETRESEDTARFYAEKLEGCGWRTEIAFCRHGRSISEAIQSVKGSGISRIRVIPLFIAFDGLAASQSKEELDSSGLIVSYSRPVSDLVSFYKILDSKVPDGW
ncbi:MAG: hypothetical protein E7Z62_08910 [Thermoplasmata archaeon]|nr:hypothetical protein [Thermoplasmata archaeon]